MKDELRIRPGERTLSTSRKHWILFLGEAAPAFIAAILPFLAAGFLAGSGLVHASIFDSAAWVVFASLWLLGATMWLSTIWTNYILDMLIVTTRRVMYVQQHSLFHREVITLHLENEQNVTVETRGIFATLFGFGTLRIETAGALTELATFEGLPDPNRIKEKILKQAAVCAEEYGRGPSLAQRAWRGSMEEYEQ